MTWTPEEFKQNLLKQEAFYHIHHPFQVAMSDGKMNPEQIRGWVANRFYYQLQIPQKDANIISNCPDREIRRRWIQRIRDHDGDRQGEGGIEAWIRLGDACGINREELISCKQVLAGVRFAVDAYVNFARTSSWQEGACASLTELFAPAIHKQRLANWPAHYSWIGAQGLEYFQSRIALANRDVEHGLEIVLEHFTSAVQQKRAVEILQFKLNVLWSIVDSIAAKFAPEYVTCGLNGLFQQKAPAIAPHYRLQWEPVSNAHVLLYPEGLVELSESAAAILLLCDGVRTAQEITIILKKEYDDPNIDSDVASFLEEAHDHGWIRNS